MNSSCHIHDLLVISGRTSNWNFILICIHLFCNIRIFIFNVHIFYPTIPSMLWHCLLDSRKGILPVKISYRAVLKVGWSVMVGWLVVWSVSRSVGRSVGQCLMSLSSQIDYIAPCPPRKLIQTEGQTRNRMPDLPLSKYCNRWATEADTSSPQRILLAATFEGLE